MKKFSAQNLKRKPFLVFGILLLAVAIGAGGCGTSQASSSSQPAAGQGQISQGQPGQSQSQGQRQRNPALMAAMEIRRLQNDTQMALTSDQKAKIKPILQTLIDTANPSQDFLQQQADAINGVFTDQQKSFLTTRPNGNANGNNPNRNRPNGSNSSGNNPSGNNPNGNGSGGNNQSGTNSNGRSNQNGRSVQPQQIYQQILDSLN